ncbi:MAG TPA: F0F1 ATP synthase subunit delta [Patescibacteria group bacterium]|nr:F0F1 ATP synthase subunit delta [Patescibacteria group bacterium]
MQNDQIYSEIINFVSTRDDVLNIENDLDLLEKSIYEEKENFDFVLKNKIKKTFADTISKLTEGQNKEEVIKKIKEFLEKIEFLEITIPKEPSEILIEKITNWLQKNTDHKIALDIKVDPKIIAGATFSYKGKFFDGSINKLINETLNSF